MKKFNFKSAAALILDILQEIEYFLNWLRKISFHAWELGDVNHCKIKLVKRLLKVRNFVDLFLINIGEMWQI